METIELTLTVEETNQILEALGRQPYLAVFQLIDKIQEQAREQARQAPAAQPRQAEADAAVAAAEAQN